MKKCGSCGFELEDGAVFCPNCGARNGAGEVRVVTPEDNSGEATIAIEDIDEEVYEDAEPAKDAGPAQEAPEIRPVPEIVPEPKAAPAAESAAFASAAASGAEKEADREVSFVFCPSCGTRNVSGEVFCSSCGAKLDGSDAGKKGNGGGKKFDAGKLKKYLPAAAIVLLAIIVISLVPRLFGGLGKKSGKDRTLGAVAFRNEDGDLMYADLKKLKNEPVLVAEEGDFNGIVSLRDPSYIYYIDDDGHLMRIKRSDIGGKKDKAEEVARRADSFSVGENGNVLVKYGEKLSWLKKGKPGSEEQIAKNVESYSTDSDMTLIVWAENGKKGKMTAYYQKLGGKSVQLAEGEDLSVRKLGDDFDLFWVSYLDGKKRRVEVVTPSGKAETVSEDCSYCDPSQKTFYFIEENKKGEKTLLYWDGKKAAEAASDVQDYKIRSTAAVTIETDKKGNETWTIYNGAARAVEYEPDEGERFASIYHDEKGKKFFLTLFNSDDETILLSIPDKGGKEPEVIAEDISGLAFRDGDYYYIEDLDKEGFGTLMKNGKKIAEDVKEFQIRGSKDAVYTMDDGDLKRVDGKEKEIAEDAVNYVYGSDSSIVVSYDMSEGGVCTLGYYNGKKLTEITDESMWFIAR